MNLFGKYARVFVPGVGAVRFSGTANYAQGETVYQVRGANVRGAFTIKHYIDLRSAANPVTPYVLVGAGWGGVLPGLPAPYDHPVIFGAEFQGVTRVDQRVLYRDEREGWRVAGRLLTASDMGFPADDVEAGQLARVVDTILRDWLRRADLDDLWRAAAVDRARAELYAADMEVDRLLDEAVTLGAQIHAAAARRERLRELLASCEE